MGHNSNTFSKDWNAAKALKQGKTLKVGSLAVHRNKSNETNKNIQTSINHLMERNTTLFGPAGHNFYNPMANQKKLGGDSGAPHNGQPTASQFFNFGPVPQGPVGFYMHGGTHLPEAFPQQPTAGVFFSGLPWEFAYGGAPCFECGGAHMEMGGITQQYGGVNDGTMDTFKEGGNWIQKATASIKKRGTEGVCTGSKFGGPSCPPGSKRYNLAKTFRAMAKKAYGGTTDGVDQDDYIAKRAGDFNNLVRMNYGMAEADNQMNRLEQELSNIPMAQYGIAYDPQRQQAIGNYNDAQNMLNQWNNQGQQSWNTAFGYLGQGADNAYNKNQYIKWDLKKSSTPDYSKAVRAVQDVHTKYATAGEVSDRAAYDKAREEYLKGFDDLYYSGAVNTANKNLPWMQPRDYMRYGMAPSYNSPFYQQNPYYWTSQNGQTNYDYGNPYMWRNVNQYPGGAGGSWSSPGWGGPNPFYNQMFGNPNMYTTLSDLDVKRGLFGSMKNPKRVKMHFNTYFNPVTGTMESAPAADQSTTASNTGAATTDNKSKLNPMQQKALDDVNREILNADLKIASEKSLNNPTEPTADQLADLAGDSTVSKTNTALENQLNPKDQSRAINTTQLMTRNPINAQFSTPQQPGSVTAPNVNQVAGWMGDARNYYGNKMAQNSGVYNMPGANLPSVTQSQDASNAYRQPIANAQQAAYNAAQNRAASNYIGQNTGVFNVAGFGTLPSVVNSQQATQDIHNAQAATPAFPYAIPSPTVQRTGRQQQMDAFQQNRFTPNGVNSYAPVPKPLPSVRSIPQGQYPPNAVTDRQKWLYDTYGDRFFGVNPGMAYGGYLPFAEDGVNVVNNFAPMQKREIGLPPMQPQAPQALQASPMTPVGGWDLTQTRKNPWNGQDIYGVTMGMLGIAENLGMADEKAAMKKYMNEQTLAHNLNAAAGPYRGNTTVMGSGYGDDWGGIQSTKTGGYVYAKGGAVPTDVPVELDDEMIEELRRQGYIIEEA